MLFINTEVTFTGYKRGVEDKNTQQTAKAPYLFIHVFKATNLKTVDNFAYKILGLKAKLGQKTWQELKEI